MAQFGRSLLSSFWAQLLIGALLVILIALHLITAIKRGEFTSLGNDLVMSSAVLALGLALIGRALLTRVRTENTAPPTGQD